MKKVLIRRASVIVAVAVLVLSFVISNLLAGKKEAPERGDESSGHPLVDVFTSAESDDSIYITLTGRLSAVNKVDIYAEVTGRLMSSGKPFKDGVEYGSGEALLRLNDQDSRLNLIAARSGFQSLLTGIQADLATDYPDNFAKWQAYIEAFDPEKTLGELPNVTNKKEKNFLVTKNVYNQFYNIRSQEAQLRKFTVSAPFRGIVHSANATPGALIRAGQKVGEFIGAEEFDLEVGLSLADRNKVKLGDPVVLTSEDIDGSWIGTVNRIGEAIDKNTQSFKVYVRVKNDALAEGMFMKAKLSGGDVQDGTLIPANLLLENSYVFAVKNDSILVKQPVNILHESDGFVLLSGIPKGTVLLGQSLSGAKEGMKVGVKQIEK